MEGITGVRDVQGNFHRWHQEISLEPDGTEGRICINTHYRRILRPSNHFQLVVPNIRRSAVNFTVSLFLQHGIQYLLSVFCPNPQQSHLCIYYHMLI